MSVEWLDLMVPLGSVTFSCILNDRRCEKDYYFRIATDLNQSLDRYQIVLKDEMHLKNFFFWRRFFERFSAISQPFHQLSDSLLSVIYRPTHGFMYSLGQYMVKHLRHVFIDILTYVALPLLFVYDLVINRMYTWPIKVEWTPELFFSGVIKLFSEALSAPFIIVCEYLRHSCSLIISLFMLILSPVIMPASYLLGLYFNQLKNIDEEACAAQKKIKLKALKVRLIKFLLGNVDGKFGKVSSMKKLDELKNHGDVDSLEKDNGEVQNVSNTKPSVSVERALDYGLFENMLDESADSIDSCVSEYVHKKHHPEYNTLINQYRCLNEGLLL